MSQPQITQSQTQSQTQTTAPTAQTSTQDQIVFTDEFKDAVREYCEKDDQRMKLQKQLKGVRSDIKDLEETIVKFMKNNNLPIFDTGEKGLFKSTVQKKRKGLSKQLIIDALSKCGKLKDNAKAEDVATYIYESRPTEDVEKLSRK